MTATDRRTPGTPDWRAVAARAASLLLRYPDAGTLATLPLLRHALAGLPPQVAADLATVAEHRATGEPTSLAGEYVTTFDFRRRCALHLTYYTAGDTRRRGEALVDFDRAYRDEGMEVTGGELPDYLPAVLDLAAICGAGWRLLRDNRVGLDLLERALEAEKSVYRHAVAAVRAMLPPATTADLAAALHLARSGPPAEMVGLRPFDITPPGPGAPATAAPGPLMPGGHR